MHDYQREFIEFALQEEVLRFGEFTLKSGRVSPYFFNSGLFNTGPALLRLARFYVQAIELSGVEFDMVFGPAYKGIPLAAAVAIAYAEQPGRSLALSFNRKEEKDHGEGGLTLGAPLAGRVLIIDDVITAGTSVNHSLSLIRAAGAKAAGVAIALDRQEKGARGDSAVRDIRTTHGIPVVSIVAMADIVEFLRGRPGAEDHLHAITRYRGEFGVGPA
jgi:orotate phosphoribosyltransferase